MGDELPTWAAVLPPFPPQPRTFPKFTWDDEEEDEAHADPKPHPEVARLAAVEERIGYCFQDSRLLRCALTSAGWVNEHPLSLGGRWADNKALEWLGDAVLYRVVTEHLVFSGDAACTGRSTPNRDWLVSNLKLAGLGEDLDLWDALYLSNGERRNNQATGRTKFLARAVEAVLGAVYLDAKAVGEDAGAVVEGLVKRWLGLRKESG